MNKTFSRAYSYDDISLVPRVVSTVNSRADVKTTNSIGENIVTTIPIISSPMKDVCNGHMAAALANYGAIGIIHRFQSVNDQVEEFVMATTSTSIGKLHNVGCAVGIDKQDCLLRIPALVEEGCKLFCIDTANGANARVIEVVRFIRNNSNHPDTIIIAGNVATREGFQYLQDIGVDMIRVGIAGGSACETRTETGIYVPMVTSIMECVEVATYSSVIADGGIKNPAQMCKALALGADYVMCGSILAGTKEAPGACINIDGQLFKLYRGAASFGAQKEFTSKSPDYVEGRESLVLYKGEVVDVLKRFEAGLRSSMSYMNANTLAEYRNNSDFYLV